MLTEVPSVLSQLRALNQPHDSATNSGFLKEALPYVTVGWFLLWIKTKQTLKWKELLKRWDIPILDTISSKANKDTTGLCMIIFHHLKQNVDYTHKITDSLSIENLNYLRSLTQRAEGSTCYVPIV